MQPIDFAVLTLAVLCVFYLPFLTGQLVVRLLFTRRRTGKTSAAAPVTGVVLDLTTRAELDRALYSIAAAPVLVLTDPENEPARASAMPIDSQVPDIDGLIRYLADERGGAAEAFLASFLETP